MLEAGNVIETHEHTGEVQKAVKSSGGHPALKIAALDLTLLVSHLCDCAMTDKKKIQPLTRNAVIRVCDAALAM